MNRHPAVVMVMVMVMSAFALGSLKAPSKGTLPVITDPNQAVARIGDLEITGQELQDEIIRAFSGDPYRFRPKCEPVKARDVLMRMLGDKALILDARQRGLLDQGTTPQRVERYRSKLLVNALAYTIVPTMPKVSDKEVAAFQEKRKKATVEQARRFLSRKKAAQLIENFYQNLIKKNHFKKFSQACATGAKVYERLKTKPVKPRHQYWIQNKQFTDEVTLKEKALVLAQWDGGTFTLADCFSALVQFAPPSRPRNLSTPKGFEAFVDRVVRVPVLESEAVRRGLDKRPDVAHALRVYENRILLGLARSEIIKTIPEPNEATMRAYYNLTIGQKDLMSRVKLDTIWCKDLAFAQKARAALDARQDFHKVLTTYTIEKKPHPQEVSPQSEGFFWSVIKAAEPNGIVGPLPTMYQRKLVWRVARLVKMTKLDYPSFKRVKDRLGGEIQDNRMDQLLKQKRKELLAKFPYKILTAKPEVFDPRYELTHSSKAGKKAG